MIRYMGRDLRVKDLWENRFVYHKTIHYSKESEATSLSSLYGLNKTCCIHMVEYYIVIQIFMGNFHENTYMV